MVFTLTGGSRSAADTTATTSMSLSLESRRAANLSGLSSAGSSSSPRSPSSSEEVPAAFGLRFSRLGAFFTSGVSLRCLLPARDERVLRPRRAAAAEPRRCARGCSSSSSHSEPDEAAAAALSSPPDGAHSSESDIHTAGRGPLLIVVASRPVGVPVHTGVRADQLKRAHPPLHLSVPGLQAILGAAGGQQD